MVRSADARRWLGVFRHRLRGLPTRHLLVLQHDLVAGRSCIVAPVVQDTAIPEALLTPRLLVEGADCRAILLDMTSVPLTVLGPPVDAEVDEDAIAAALDAIFRGYPVGLPSA